MTSKELVKRAIDRTGPERVPLLYYNKLLERSDILRVGYHPAASFHSDDPNRSEWGFRWERLDATMECPKSFEGFPIALVTAGLLALSFMGSSGLSVF